MADTNSTCIVCERPLSGRQERFCCDKCCARWHQIGRNRTRRKGRHKVVIHLLRRTAALMAAYGDPREIGWDRWVENRSVVQ